MVTAVDIKATWTLLLSLGHHSNIQTCVQPFKRYVQTEKNVLDLFLLMSHMYCEIQGARSGLSNLNPQTANSSRVAHMH